MNQLAYFYLYQGENISPDITHCGEPKIGMKFNYKGMRLIVTSTQYCIADNKMNVILDKI